MSTDRGMHAPPDPRPTTTGGAYDIEFGRPIPSVFCINPQLQTHRYDQLPQPTPTNRIQLVPRRNEDPVLEVMNTIAEAQSRKRRRDEEEYNGRHYGQQTGMDDIEVLSEVPPIAQSKRFRVERSRLNRQVVKESKGTSTSPPPSESLSNEPSTSSPTVTTRPQRFNSPRAREARRARRQLRGQQEVQRMVDNHNFLQQVNGLVPSGNEQHTCNEQCMHQLNTLFRAAAQLPPPPPQNYVPPAVAPMLRPNPVYQTATFQTYFNTTTLQQLAAVPYMMNVIVPPLPTLAAPVPIRPPQPPAYQPYSLHPSNLTNDVNVFDFLRQQQQLLNPYVSLGLDRHHPHLFGLDIDVPIGATKFEIDNYTDSLKYTKDGEKEETCTVCLSDFEEGENIRKLRCNHIFHPECIEKWLDINKKCPMCRKDIDKSKPEPQEPIPVYQSVQPPPVIL